MEINGLPLHALVVHAAVVLAPLAALLALTYAAVPRWRDRLRWPLVALAVPAAGAVWIAHLSGEQLIAANQYGGPLLELVETHEQRAGVLRLVALAFAVAATAVAVLHRRVVPAPVRVLALLLLTGLAVSTLVYAVLTGDAGAQIAWYGVRA